MLGWFKALFQGGCDENELASRMGMPLADIQKTSRNYRELKLPKKSRGRLRIIHAPNAELKSLQRRLLRRVLAKLRIHGQATGFRSGVSFVDNARCHQSQAVVVRIDLVDFFPSITAERVRQYFRGIGWGAGAAELLTSLMTFEEALPQGAPTSPCLSNLVNFRLDARLAAVAAKNQAVYTRYADDITFSLSDASDSVGRLIYLALQVIREEGYRPHLKTKFDVRRQHQQQMVTGLVVNQRANLTRQRRRWLRAVRHRQQLCRRMGYTGPAPTITEEQLLGWESLQRMIDRGVRD